MQNGMGSLKRLLSRGENVKFSHREEEFITKGERRQYIPAEARPDGVRGIPVVRILWSHNTLLRGVITLREIDLDERIAMREVVARSPFTDEISFTPGGTSAWTSVLHRCGIFSS
jgi:hypothetical protein